MSREVETDMTDTELKPCPFCGSANLRFRDSDIEGWISHVECLDCDDMLGPMSKYKYDDVEDARADAANVWNRRALPRERGEVKEIIAAQVQSVCDWDDRTSPDDYPDHLLITPEALTEILENVVDLAASRIRSCLLDKPEAVEGVAVDGWYDGAPGKPWAEDWFIAETTWGARVVLTALPEEWTYDFKTADDTYIKADKIKRWMQFPDSQYIAPTPADTDAAQSGGEAFDKIVAARKAYVDAVAAYNARLEFVRAERERGNWLNVDPEYAAMSEAQSAFYRTVQDLADAAIRQRAEEKP
ncbi:restriction alleviation protein, Lar family [Sinorhizobium medicae]|nr:restriction alleviation protein, Lar family [Sinorhizobium medicae]MDX0796286.1 restriction alleviation protein, Lar family [Sinorhizobium medicae]